ncbi:MAG: nickel pincer cofactor biosynthesis protein LarC [Oligoflexales bacterium]|nr:nickel pincer cofactor biosynthesis protein LarC [Oligoflexales bacterium]
MARKILKVDPFSGISGDMMLAALCAVTGETELLLSLPDRLEMGDVEIKIEKVKKRGIMCDSVTIIDHKSPEERCIEDIFSIIDNGKLPAPVKSLSKKIFMLIAEAEAEVHGLPLSKIHFHEVGAIDSIFDIVGSALLLDTMSFDKVVSTPICTGKGTVKCDHGILPVPAPATEILLRGMPCYPSEVNSEATTPTGAAILKALNPSFQASVIRIEKTAYGAGKKEFERPNCLRLSLGEEEPEESLSPPEYDQKVWVINANIDDMSGEVLGEYFQKKLLALGALDFTISSVLMKKGRPGFKLEILAAEENFREILRVIFEETTTIGVRYYPVFRSVLKREVKIYETPLGPVSFKCVFLPSGRIRKMPEYEDCRKAALDNGISLEEAYRIAIGHAGHKDFGPLP